MNAADRQAEEFRAHADRVYILWNARDHGMTEPVWDRIWPTKASPQRCWRCGHLADHGEAFRCGKVTLCRACFVRLGYSAGAREALVDAAQRQAGKDSAQDGHEAPPLGALWRAVPPDCYQYEARPKPAVGLAALAGGKPGADQGAAREGQGAAKGGAGPDPVTMAAKLRAQVGRGEGKGPDAEAMRKKLLERIKGGES